jgi:membrane protein DedA with SNARE-associated domain
MNALAAALWACGLGIGAYLIGPTVVDLVGDIGLVAGIVIGVVVVVVLATEVIRRRRRALAGD